MQVIITSGHPHSGYLDVHKELELGGVDSAQPSRREGVTPATLTESLLRAHNTDLNVSGIVGQLSPGKAWQELAVDLFLGNLSQRNWGWADASTTWLLDFWLQFDEQTRFVLVYTSPSITIVTRPMFTVVLWPRIALQRPRPAPMPPLRPYTYVLRAFATE